MNLEIANDSLLGTHGTPVPFGGSTLSERRAWDAARWALGDDTRAAGIRRDCRHAHDLAFTHAMAWADAVKHMLRDLPTDLRQDDVTGPHRWSDRMWQHLSTLALTFADEYERQEFLFLTGELNTKRGYALWWADVLRFHDLF